MDNILIVLENKTEKNSRLISKFSTLIKSKGVNITYSSIVQIPFKYPIDSEDKELQIKFENSEHLLKSFESNLNQLKVPYSRTNGLIYKVRDYFYGAIELSREVNSDLIIMPKSMFENFSEILNSDFKKNSIESIPLRNVKGINNLIKNFESSILLWQDDN
tara:strand:- start:5726 stop:6208 length:483 start_codon:yes stop_codon:yes gene_type:complete